jgi:hypothetical protein
MKIRYYQHINGARWIGFGLAMMSVFILSSANIATQWVGWSLSVVSCICGFILVIKIEIGQEH